MRVHLRHLCFPVVLALASFACGPLQAGMVYVALGDSDTFGNDESTPSSTMPNYGNQGYVSHFADFLGSINGGVRPQLANLAISGELSTSFLSGVPPAGWPYREQQWNLNYPIAPTSQNSLMLAALDAARAAGSTTYVTLNIGNNDFNYLFATAAYQTATPAQQQALFVQTLNQVANNYATILGEIHLHAPGAHVFLPNFYDAFLPSDAGYAAAEMAYGAANQVLAQITANSGSAYVDFYSVIHGNVLQYTNHGVSGHLNQAGYAAVALTLDAAAVPEPASVAMLGIGLVSTLGYGRRRLSSSR